MTNTTKESANVSDFLQKITRKSTVSKDEKVNKRAESVKALTEELSTLLESTSLSDDEMRQIEKLKKAFSINSMKSYQQLKTYSTSTDECIDDIFTLCDAIEALKESEENVKRIAYIASII